MGGRDAVMEGLDGLVGGPRSAPGIPRSRRSARSRPFRPAKGAWDGLVGGPVADPGILLEGEGWEAHPNAGFGGLCYSPEPIASVWREE